MSSAGGGRTLRTYSSVQHFGLFLVHRVDLASWYGRLIVHDADEVRLPVVQFMGIRTHHIGSLALAHVDCYEPLWLVVDRGLIGLDAKYLWDVSWLKYGRAFLLGLLS